MSEEEKEILEPEETVEGTPKTGKKEPAIPTSSGVPLDQRAMFINHMTAIGVTPREAIPTIADLFFDGDIEDLNWLNRVLQRSAAGYVKAAQRRLIMDWWAKTRNLPYDPDEYFTGEEGEEKGKRGAAKAGKEEKAPFKPIDPGQGWRVGKDRQGDWTPLPGGPLTYEEALDRAERRAVIASYGLGGGDEEGEAAPEGEEGKPARRGKIRPESFVETMMLKILENVLDGGGSRKTEADAKVEALEGQIAQMHEDRQEERFERLEGLIANVAARDPWEDSERVEKIMRQRGWGPNVVTDQSPAVQLIKDSTDKLDRNVGRLMGIIERTALRSEEFQPETTRTTEQRETKAGQLLETAQGRSRSKQLRRDTFGF